MLGAKQFEKYQAYGMPVHPIFIEINRLLLLEDTKHDLAKEVRNIESYKYVDFLFNYYPVDQKKKGKKHQWLRNINKDQIDHIKEYLVSIIVNYIHPGVAPKNRLCKIIEKRNMEESVIALSRIIPDFISADREWCKQNICNKNFEQLARVEAINIFIADIDAHSGNIGRSKRH